MLGLNHELRCDTEDKNIAMPGASADAGSSWRGSWQLAAASQVVDIRNHH